MPDSIHGGHVLCNPRALRKLSETWLKGPPGQAGVWGDTSRRSRSVKPFFAQFAVHTTRSKLRLRQHTQYLVTTQELNFKAILRHKEISRFMTQLERTYPGRICPRLEVSSQFQGRTNLSVIRKRQFIFQVVFVLIGLHPVLRSSALTQQILQTNKKSRKKKLKLADSLFEITLGAAKSACPPNAEQLLQAEYLDHVDFLERSTHAIQLCRDLSTQLHQQRQNLTDAGEALASIVPKPSGTGEGEHSLVPLPTLVTHLAQSFDVLRLELLYPATFFSEMLNVLILGLQRLFSRYVRVALKARKREPGFVPPDFVQGKMDKLKRLLKPRARTGTPGTVSSTTAGATTRPGTGDRSPHSDYGDPPSEDAGMDFGTAPLDGPLVDAEGGTLIDPDLQRYRLVLTCCLLEELRWYKCLREPLLNSTVYTLTSAWLRFSTVQGATADRLADQLSVLARDTWNPVRLVPIQVQKGQRPSAPPSSS